MKVIFSRKGFDSKYGGGCSPILPDGKLLSIPIPSISEENGIPYTSISTQNGSYYDIMSQLRLHIPENGLCHFDPDLIPSAYPRKKGWRGIFGQSFSASSHLKNNEVEIGDIFLFYGSFKKTAYNSSGSLVFIDNQILHVIFGYLIIGDIIELGKETMMHFKSKNSSLKWAFYHPHLINDKYGERNVVYFAKDNIGDKNGYGAFYFNKDLVLSSPNKSRSIWRLPNFFHYQNGIKISRHSDINRFADLKTHCELKTVNIGQEFVVSGSSSAYAWATDLIRNSQTFS
jgi:hypothetical protein